MKRENMATELTKRQEEILEYIQLEILQKKMAPSLMEIGQKFKINNPNGVRNHILALEKKGYLKRSVDKARSLQIVKPSPARISRVITAAKKKIWRKKYYFYYLPVYINLRTRKGYPFFVGPYSQKLEKKIHSIAVNHGWEILELEILPDQVTIGLTVSSDHSIERIVRNLKHCALALELKHPVHFRGKKTWSSGFAASTDPWILKELTAEHKKSLKQRDKSENDPGEK